MSTHVGKQNKSSTRTYDTILTGRTIYVRVPLSNRLETIFKLYNVSVLSML